MSSQPAKQIELLHRGPQKITVHLDGHDHPDIRNLSRQESGLDGLVQNFLQSLVPLQITKNQEGYRRIGALL
jgi:hypothetical protein